MSDKNIDLLPTGVFGIGPPRRAIIDSGTTLAYLPADMYEKVMTKVHNTFFVLLLFFVSSIKALSQPRTPKYLSIRR